jgi:ATP-dependent Clp protease ATP-binding subunit ClpB
VALRVCLVPQELEGQYLRSKGLLEELAEIKREIEETEWAIAQNERAYRAEKAAELKYTELPKLQSRFQEVAEKLKVGGGGGIQRETGHI